MSQQLVERTLGRLLPWRLRHLLVLLLITGVVLVGAYLIRRYVMSEDVTSSRPLESLRLMTWNVGKFYPLQVDSRAADEDLAYIAKVIREAEPHVVALQELKGPEQLGRLATMLGSQWRAHVPEDVYDRRAGLLTRPPARFLGLPTSSGRIAQAAEVSLPGKQRTSFLIASVHLDAFDSTRRLAQAEEIIAGSQREGIPNVILAGDFNFDASVAAQRGDDQRLYQLLTHDMVDAARSAGVTSLISQRLDYVFYRSSLVSKAAAKVLREKRINTMDHDPLVVELSLEQPPRR